MAALPASVSASAWFPAGAWASPSEVPGPLRTEAGWRVVVAVALTVSPWFMDLILFPVLIGFSYIDSVRKRIIGKSGNREIGGDNRVNGEPDNREWTLVFRLPGSPGTRFPDFPVRFVYK